MSIKLFLNIYHARAGRETLVIDFNGGLITAFITEL